MFQVGASIVWVLGVLGLNGAMTYGKAGPSQALIQLQSPIQLVMEIAIFSKMPTYFGVLGMGLCILGALVIILLGGKKHWKVWLDCLKT